jgi:hypothetical protein
VNGDDQGGRERGGEREICLKEKESSSVHSKKQNAVTIYIYMYYIHIYCSYVYYIHI